MAGFASETVRREAEKSLAALRKPGRKIVMLEPTPVPADPKFVFETFYDKLPDFQSFFNWWTIMSFWVCLAAVKIIHEFGHGLSCKAFGGEVHVDGGIRSGQDVLKALCLGAKGTFIGRAFLYGLAAMGEAGVALALQIIAKELDVTMALCGERDVKNLRRHNLLGY